MPLLLAYNGRRGSAYTPAESGRVESRESFRVKILDAACYIFVSQTLVMVHGGCYLELDIDVKKLIFLVKNNKATYKASR
jgi:hypothetical protein